jgi:hypothetical protein
MENLLETIERAGLTAKIYYDQDAESPDHWGNDDAFLVYDHRDFTVKRRGFDPSEIFETLNETKRKTFNGYWVFPVYAYIHSGVSLSLGRNSYPFNDRWDVSFKGFALVKRQKGWTYTEKKAYKVAETIVSEWNQYLSGDVYGFVIEDHNGEHLDSCWGFYGIDYVRSEVNSILGALIKQQQMKRITLLKTLIRNHVPLNKRLELLNA